MGISCIKLSTFWALTYFIPSGFAYSVINFERYFVFAIPIEIGSFNSSNIFFFKYKANSSISDSPIYPVTSAKNSLPVIF